MVAANGLGMNRLSMRRMRFWTLSTLALLLPLSKAQADISAVYSASGALEA